MKILGRTNNNKSILPKDEITTELNKKQDKLVSSTNIKTINNTSILGSGNITTPNTTYSEITDAEINAGTASTARAISGRRVKKIIDNAKEGKQDELVSGTNIKTVNGESLVGAGDITISGDTLPIGSQVPFGSLTIPDNWLLCDGRAISRIDYSELFSVIGTSYGAGDGTTTFNLPNKKGRTSVGHDSSQTEFDTIGETGGASTHTLTVAQIPSHSHTNKYYDGAGSSTWGYNYTNGKSNTSTATPESGGIGYTGGGAAHNNLQPYQTDVWIIKAKQSSGVVATVVDTLDSTSPTNALSANMGRELKDLINDSVKGNANANNIVSNIFIGTQAEYDALPNKTGILAIIKE